MAPAQVVSFNPSTIPGLGCPLSSTDLDISRFTYNGLARVEDVRDLKSTHREHIIALLGIIDRHSMGKIFGIHSAHRHEEIPVGTVRLEEDMSIRVLSRTTPAAMDAINPDTLHATVFQFIKNAYVGFEFAKGASPTAGAKVSPEFLTEIAKYLTDNKLNKLLALEVKDYSKLDAGGTAEIEVLWGNTSPFTIVVPISDLANVDGLVQTGWSVPFAGLATDSDPPAGEYWNAVASGPRKGSHAVFVDSSESVTSEGLVKALVDHGVFKAGLLSPMLKV
ncbi:hypothetical protein ONS95_001508 [Cadophora gregata]|uniref:uncharacterized protein n=1 Tax=Cadophora gregata TaxID=51156 RepID=UPI0026DC4421|nr:uncharacterized protein ONS95_001508 [Cadophora gregata]KAK0111132.1 hypothetical protein ONS95_001508 [Cadophora gregata]KAK0112401.1 hypothetical protein ONS96_001645 [Cadophora gregata f. sp. sojae]